MGKFVKQDDIEHEQFDWGDVGWRLFPKTGAQQLVVMDVTLDPGGGHDFHKHPGQEEMIIVKRGRITQYLEQESTTLEVDDSVFIEADLVHASFNEGDETALLQVIIAPSLREGTGYGLVDVSGEEPWASLRDRSGAAAG
jgi:quercetin dioxygenase-like cupin family protein